MTDRLTDRPLETIPLEVVAGQVRGAGTDRIEFVSASGHARAILPARGENYLRRLMDGCDLESLIIEIQSRGQSVDYRVLKSVVSALYYGGCLKHRDRLRKYFESWDTPPLEEPWVDFPLARVRAAEMNTQNGIEVFVAASAWMVIGLSLTAGFRSWGLESSQLIFFILLFLPSTLLSCLAFLQSAAGLLLGHRRFRLGARISPLGPHFEPDSRLFEIHSFELLMVSFAGSLFLPALSWALIAEIARAPEWDGRPETITRAMSILFVALCLMPGLRTAFSQARSHLVGKKQTGLGRALTPVLLGLALLGAFAAAAYAAQVLFLLAGALIKCRFFTLPGFLQILMSCLAATWGVLLLRDLFASLDALSDDVSEAGALRAWISSTLETTQQTRLEADKKRIRMELRRQPLFQTIPEDLREELVQTARLKTVPRGARLIRQGDATTELFYVIRGSCGVFRRTEAGAPLSIRLEAGSLFGEAGFFLNEARTADVIALEDSDVIEIRRPDGFDRLRVTAASVIDTFRKKIWATQALAGSILFRDLPAEAVMHILNFSDVVDVDPGTAIVREGEGSDALWICVQGESSVTVHDLPRPDILKGDVIGEIGLLWNSPRTASVTARSPSVFLKLSAPAFRRLLSRNLNFAARLQKLAEARLEADRKAKVA